MKRNTKDIPGCVITGGTSGIGRAAVQLFAENGYRIATCGRNEKRLAALRSSALQDRDSHVAEQVDLCDIGQTRQFAEMAVSFLRRVDVLVNNAAAAPLAPLDEIDEQTFEQTTNSNIRSTFYLTQRIWRQMKIQGGGVIVNISSLAAVDPFPGFSIYGASKAWLDLMTTALATEGAEHGIRVYSVRAGAVETPLLRQLFPDFPTDQCVSPTEVAAQILACADEPETCKSGSHLAVTRQGTA